ncbi:hypothetical protein [Paenibacillus ginsengihumi]|uniref:hypothetical protein n=1 Tax=Paenibacillus ginsengihumi TaxID=431596 RepID=UPI000369773E|nr:hypothetical protein [Paenibacillus ginsengihumi]
MKALIMLTLLGLAACDSLPQATATEAQSLPKETMVRTSNPDTNAQDFSVHIIAPKQIKAHEPFTIEATLTNLTDATMNIEHASTIFYFSIKDHNGQVLNTFVMPMKGVARSIRGKATITEQYRYTFAKPGLYEVSATGKFTIIGDGDNRQAYELETPKAKIDVYDE